jgi:hypothetical protein
MACPSLLAPDCSPHGCGWSWSHSSWLSCDPASGGTQDSSHRYVEHLRQVASSCMAHAGGSIWSADKKHSLQGHYHEIEISRVKDLRPCFTNITGASSVKIIKTLCPHFCLPIIGVIEDLQSIRSCQCLTTCGHNSALFCSCRTDVPHDICLCATICLHILVFCWSPRGNLGQVLTSSEKGPCSSLEKTAGPAKFADGSWWHDGI